MGAAVGVVLILLALGAGGLWLYAHVNHVDRSAMTPAAIGAFATPGLREQVARAQMQAYSRVLCRDVETFQGFLTDAARDRPAGNPASASRDLLQADLWLDRMQRDAGGASPFVQAVNDDLTVGIGYSRNTVNELRKYLDTPDPALVERIKDDIAGAASSIAMARALMSKQYVDAGGGASELCVAPPAPVR